MKIKRDGYEQVTTARTHFTIFHDIHPPPKTQFIKVFKLKLRAELKKKMNEKPLSIFVFFFCREDAGRRPRLSFCVVAAPYTLPVFDIRFRWNWRMQRVFFSLRWKMSKFNFIQKLNQIEPCVFQGHLRPKFLSEWQHVGYRSVALETFYNFGFGCGTVGVVVRAQTQVERGTFESFCDGHALWRPVSSPTLRPVTLHSKDGG